MLSLNNVYNVTLEDVTSKTFDIGIFASGYEQRATFLAKSMGLSQFRKVLVLGFNEHQDNSIRIANDDFYSQHYSQPVLVSGHDQADLYIHLRKLFADIEGQNQISVLMDYTSMARLWYSGILNFIRFASNQNVELFTNYSVGVYNNDFESGVFLDFPYTAIKSLPGLEGSLSSNNKTLLTIAVGFTPFVIKSIIEEIEPNHVIGILPKSLDKSIYDHQSELIKSNILHSDVDDWMVCSIDDLESIFRLYAEITNSNMNEKDIIFLSLGPKIFTLASILVSQRFDQVTCLYLASNRESKDVVANGHLICNRISYRLI